MIIQNVASLHVQRATESLQNTQNTNTTSVLDIATHPLGLAASIDSYEKPQKYTKGEYHD